MLKQYIINKNDNILLYITLHFNISLKITTKLHFFFKENTSRKVMACNKVNNIVKINLNYQN